MQREGAYHQQYLVEDEQPGADAAPRRAGSNANGHGGRRKGAGRKRTLPGPARGPHATRPFHDRRLPVHVVLRVTQEVGRLRRAKAYAAVRLAMIALVLAGGALFGALQGWLIHAFRLQAFIVTLAGMLLFRGLTYQILDNVSLSPFPKPYYNVANGFLNGLLGGDGFDLFTLVIFG